MSFAHIDRCDVVKFLQLNNARYLVILQVHISHANKRTIEEVTESWECTNYNTDYMNWAYYTVLTMVVSDHVAVRYRLSR